MDKRIMKMKDKVMKKMMDKDDKKEMMLKALKKKVKK